MADNNGDRLGTDMLGPRSRWDRPTDNASCHPTHNSASQKSQSVAFAPRHTVIPSPRMKPFPKFGSPPVQKSPARVRPGYSDLEGDGGGSEELAVQMSGRDDIGGRVVLFGRVESETPIQVSEQSNL